MSIYLLNQRVLVLWAGGYLTLPYLTYLGICIESPGVDDRAFHKAPSGGRDAHVYGLPATEYGGQVVARVQQGWARGALRACTLTLATVVQPHTDLMTIRCIILDPRPEYVITIQVVGRFRVRCVHRGDRFLYACTKTNIFRLSLSEQYSLLLPLLLTTVLMSMPTWDALGS